MPMLVINSDPERLWGKPLDPPDYLCFEFDEYQYKENTKLCFSIGRSGVNTITSISYSVNNGDSWTTIDSGFGTAYSNIVQIPVISGLKVLFKGEATSLNGAQFKITNLGNSWGEYPLIGNISGNPMCLLYNDDFEDKVEFPENSDSNFKSLFEDYCGFFTFDGFKLPATKLTPNCYLSIFKYCSNMVKAPELPALILPEKCYSFMFCACTKVNYIKMMGEALADGVSVGNTTSPFYEWGQDIGGGGTLVISKDAQFELPNGESGNLYWTVEEV